MPDTEPKSRNSIWILIIALIILVAVSSPWWMNKLSPNGEETATPSEDTTQAVDTSAEQAAKPEAAQPSAQAKAKPEGTLTEAELAEAGNAIINYTVEELSGLSLKLKVNYACGEEHGAKVMMGGRLVGVENEYTPTPVPNPTKGTVILPITVKNPGVSKMVVLFLYEEGHADEPFAQRRFPFERRF